MTAELFWTIALTAITVCMWAPHILMRIFEMGIVPALSDPRHEYHTQTPWARRAIKAHTNAIENLAVWAVLIFALIATDSSTATTATTALIFFIVRVLHYIVYTLGLPWIRTPLFLIGFGCQIYLVVVLLG